MIQMLIRTGMLLVLIVLAACSGQAKPPVQQGGRRDTTPPERPPPATIPPTPGQSTTHASTLPEKQTASVPSTVTAASEGEGTATVERVPADGALRTLNEFMQARVVRADQQARAYLAPEIRETVPYEQLVSPSSPRWLSYTVLDARQAADGAVEATVQIALAAQPVGTEVMGFSTQSIRLEQRDGRWVVVELSEMAEQRRR